MQIKAEFKDQVFAKWGKKLQALGEGGAHKAMARALNAEGKKMKTAVQGALAKQTSIPSRKVASALRVTQANPRLGGDLSFTVTGTGKHLPLRDFKPKQGAAGTGATVWGGGKMHNRAFMGPRPGLLSAKMGGHVLTRTGKGRFPIKKLYGPAVPKEMVKDLAAEAFHDAPPKVIARLEREIKKVIY